jgi:ribosomal protein S18 acetylase RimI-like enzyme
MQIRAATPEDAAAIARVHLISWRAAFEPVMSPDLVARKNLDEAPEITKWQKRLREEPERITLVAVLDERVIGFITGGAARDGIAGYDSELYQIYLLPDSQRRGIGQKLVAALAHELFQAGYQTMLVWVMTLNPAVKFYRDTLGGVYLAERPIHEVEGKLSEAAYGYTLARLIEKLANA